MNPALSVRSTVVIIVVFGALLAGWLGYQWQARSLQEPVRMHTAASGRLYIQAGNGLFEYAPGGALLARYDLSRLGIRAMRGDFAVFPDGDVLLTRRSEPLSVLERLAVFFRVSDRSDQPPEHPDAGLSRCDLERMACTPFTSEPLDLKRAFHLRIDPADRAVYLARPARHTVSRFDFDGRLQQETDSGLAFPNQIRVRDGRLYIANTNRHEIRMVSPEAATFGRKLGSIDLKAVDAPEQAGRWPAAFNFIGDDIWVVASESDMRHGSIYRFEGEGRFLGRIAADRIADPFSVVPYNGSVLVSDGEAFTIHALDTGGRLAGAFPGGELERFFAGRERTYRRYDLLSNLFLIGFCVALAAGIVIGVRQVLESGELKQFEAAGRMPVDPRDPAITWIEPTARFRRTVRAIQLMLFLTVLLVPAVFYLGAVEVGWMVLLMVIGFIVILYPFTKLARAKIGVKDGLVILKKDENRYAAGEDGQIAYSDTHIMIDTIALPLGNHQMRIFETRDLVEHVYPRLKNANAFKPVQMQLLLFKHKDELVVCAVLGVILLAGAAWLAEF